jgi:hypothetical protein
MWHTAERVHRADAEAFVDALQWQRATAGWSGTRLGHRHRMVLLPAPKPFNDSFAPGVESSPLRGVARTAFLDQLPPPPTTSPTTGAGR